MISDSYRDLVYKDAVEQSAIIAELQHLFQRSLEQIRYQALLLNNVRDAVVVWDLQEKIAYVNPAAQALFGWGKEVWLSMPVERYMNLFKPAVELPSGEVTGGMRIERCFKSQADEVVWVSSHVYALRDQSANGKLIGYMDVCRDITERKYMEARVQEAQIQLIQATRLAAIGELASGIAHHINNPLTTIIAESQLLLQNLPDDHTGRDSARAIEEAGWRVQRAVQQLLDFSQPPSNTLEILSINNTIQYALELVGDQIRANQVEMIVDLGQGLPYLRGNARQLVDLWVNLLMLAHGATSDGQAHTIHIHSKAPSRFSILVEISDDGQPIPVDELATLFEPGFLKDLGSRGTGIELTLCQEIVRQHRGQITAESNPNDVTIFRVLLPAER
jgi:two-component system NtrC family sensor kinase